MMQPLVDIFPMVVGCNATAEFDTMNSSKEGGCTMNIADRIQSLRKIKGVSQEELADKIGVTRCSDSDFALDRRTEKRWFVCANSGKSMCGGLHF